MPELLESAPRIPIDHANGHPERGLPGQLFLAEPLRELVALEQRRHPTAREAMGDVLVGDPVQDPCEARLVVQLTSDLLCLPQTVDHLLVRLRLEGSFGPAKDRVAALLG